jgi:hypothetical protein
MEYKHLVVRVYQSRCIGMMWEHTEEHTEDFSLVLILNLVYTRPHIARNSSQLRAPVQIAAFSFPIMMPFTFTVNSAAVAQCTVGRKLGRRQWDAFVNMH